jgi:hypothetical protein
MLRLTLTLTSLLAACSLEPLDLSNFTHGGQTTEELTPDPPDLPDVGWGSVDKPVILDLPPIQGCSQLDVLFVVDDSGSMANEQEKLAAAVPGFIEQLRAFDLGFDMHIGVTTTNLEYPSNPEECRSLGALVSQTPMGACLDGDRSYLTQDDDIEAVFPCLFSVGVSGYGAGEEYSAGAMVAALLPSYVDVDVDAWPGSYRKDTCNVDFFRPDAGLVIVLLTDEDDRSSAGNAIEWASQLWYLQEGPLVLVAFIQQLECGPVADVQELERLTMFVPSHVSSICAEDFAAELDEATKTIRAFCFYEPVE